MEVTGLSPTLLENQICCLQHLLNPVSFTQQINVQTISTRGVQRMGMRARQPEKALMWFFATASD